jgi:hypothetical protein
MIIIYTGMHAAVSKEWIKVEKKTAVAVGRVHKNVNCARGILPKKK